MSDLNVKKFLVLYVVPASVMADWTKTDPEIREPAERKMRAEWEKWTSDHAEMIVLTEVAVHTKQVTEDGVVDVENYMHLYAFVEAESHETAVKAFENHPHLQIPQASIEVIEVRAMRGV